MLNLVKILVCHVAVQQATVESLRLALLLNFGAMAPDSYLSEAISANCSQACAVCDAKGSHDPAAHQVFEEGPLFRLLERFALDPSELPQWPKN